MKSVCPTETTPKALQTRRRERKGDTGEERHLEVYSEKSTGFLKKTKKKTKTTTAKNATKNIQVKMGLN